MTRIEYIDHLLAILCYDSLVNVLSIASRYWLHREIINNRKDVFAKAIVTDANGDILHISQMIKDRQWERPALRYNSDRVLEKYNETHGIWLTFKPEEHV